MSVLGALILALPSLAAASSTGRAPGHRIGCTHGARGCLRGVVLNRTGAALTRQLTGTFVAGSGHTHLPRRVVGRGVASGWAVQPHLSARPVAMVATYRAGPLTYSVAAVRVGSGRRDEFVACWEPRAQNAGATRSCAATWGGAGHRGNAVAIGGHPTIPAAGERCHSTIAAGRLVDCTASGQISGPRSGPAGHARPGRMALVLKNVGAGPVRVLVGHGHPCTIHRRGGRCVVTGRPPGAEIAVRNLRTQRASVAVEIVAEADGPRPPADLAQYLDSRPEASGWPKGCTNGYRGQGSAYWDGNGPGWPNAYWNGPTNQNAWPSSCTQPGDWMAQLSNGTRLDQLTIPGTHDTGTYTFGASSPEYWAQSLSIPDQLAVGIRALDIRLENEGCPSAGCDSANPLGIYHGSKFTGGYLNSTGGTTGPDGSSSPNGAQYSVMPQLQTFLNHNPTETIVMNIQDESSDTPHFAQQVNDVLDHYEGVSIPNPDGTGSHPMVYDGSQGVNPPLRAIRGEVVVIADGGTPGSPSDYLNPPSGLVWPQTTKAGATPPFVQDNYKSPGDKYDDIDTELAFASTLDPYASIADGGELNNFHQDMNINFTSASTAAFPMTYAGNVGEHWIDECTGDLSGQEAGCNILTAEDISHNGNDCQGSGQYDGPSSLCRYGVVYTDFAGPTLLDALIGQNPTASSANLRVQQSASPSSVAPGGTVTYTVTVNDGDVEALSGDLTADASMGALGVELPPGATLQGPISWSPSGYPANWSGPTTPTCQTQQGAAVQCALGTVPEFGTLTATYTVALAADAGEQQTSSATVSTSTPNTLAGQSTTATSTVNVN